ncbi:MAG: ABC transporter permease [Haloferacaceae archaeon]
MGKYRYLLRRVVFAVVVLYIVVTLMFVLFTLTPETKLKAMLFPYRMANADPEKIRQIKESYYAARRLDEPLLSRYLGWLVDVTLFRWGYSLTLDRPVTELVAAGTLRSLAYIVPATVFSVTGGIGIGFLAAWRQGSLGERVARIGVYLLFGVPSFFLGGLLLLSIATGEAAGSTLQQWILPVVVLTLSLLAGQVSFARSEAMEYVNAPFVTFLRAKGFGGRAIMRRVLRNAAIPILSLVFSELLLVLLLNVFVIEFLFHIQGLGRLTYVAANERDLPLVFGTTVVIVAVAVLGSLLQDAVVSSLDPRVDAFD